MSAPTTYLSRRLVTIAPMAIVVLAAIAAGSATYAFVRLATSSTSSTGLFWGSMPVAYAPHASGSDDVPEDDRDLAAIRLAFDTWEDVDGSSVRFSEVTTPAIVEGPKVAANDGVNLVFFDEANTTRRFTNASFIVAITPVFFQSDGRIVDADIIFNGRDHAFTTNPGEPGESLEFCIQNIATHEIGHLLGLDHCGVHGATMIPFATPGETRLRSLSEDEVAAMRAIYPSGASVGAVSGVVQHQATGVGVNGAHVVVTSAETGTPISSALTRANGTFTVTGVPSGSYRLLVEPLDGPTTEQQLQRSGLETGFASTLFGGIDAPETLQVSAGVTTQLGTLVVQPDTGYNVTGATPTTVRRGRTTTLVLQGSGLNGSAVEIRGPGLSHSATVASNQIAVTVAAGAPVGLRDIYLRKGSGSAREMVALPGGLEIIADPPQVSAVSPAQVPLGGGLVEVLGQGFTSGARVLAGDQVVPRFDVVFDGPGQLTVSLPGAAQPGTFDLTVINPDGQESRLGGALTYTGDPQPVAVLPSTGPSAGGVPCTIEGSQFANGATVRFGTALATAVHVSADGTRIDCMAPRGTVGALVAVTVRNPDGSSGSLSSAYRYLAPRLDTLTPNVGSSAGGAVVTIEGDGFAPGAQVFFGASAALGVSFLSQNALRVDAPAHPAGPATVTVVGPDAALGGTGPTGFTFVDAQQPDVTSVAPTSGSSAGGQAFTVRGQGFEAGAIVRIGGVDATSVEVLSATEITAITPAGSAGARDVLVRNPSGLQDVAFGAYTYIAAASSGGGGGGGMGCSFSEGGAAPGAATPLWTLALVLFAAALARRRARPARLAPAWAAPLSTAPRLER